MAGALLRPDMANVYGMAGVETKYASSRRDKHGPRQGEGEAR